jgi:hypothetical protein
MIKFFSMEDLVMENLIVWAILCGICGAACATIAEKKYRDPQTWFWLGFFLFPFSFFVLLCLPEKK